MQAVYTGDTDGCYCCQSYVCGFPSQLWQKLWQLMNNCYLYS